MFEIYKKNISNSNGWISDVSVPVKKSQPCKAVSLHGERKKDWNSKSIFECNDFRSKLEK